MRQGCSLSPFLFSMLIEVVVKPIKKEKKFNLAIKKVNWTCVQIAQSYTQKAIETIWKIVKNKGFQSSFRRGN
jgi:hypothetical protein